MYLKPRELCHTVHETADQGEDSTSFLIIALMLLGLIGYPFIQHAIPVISKVVCDFLKYCYGVAGGLV